MNPNPNPQTPAPVRPRWPWGRIVLLALIAGLGALGWNQYTWHRAVRQLEAAGITARPGVPSVEERLRWAAQNNWKRFLDPGTWTVEVAVWKIDFDKAEHLRNLDALAPALRRINPEWLDLEYGTALENVDGLKGLTALRILQLGNYPALQNLDGLEDLTALERLIIYECPALRSVSGLRRLTALQHLELSDCPALVNADAFKGLTSLRSLQLIKCSALENVDGLQGLTALKYLDLSGCHALKGVANLAGCSSLEIVNLTGCRKVPPEAIAVLKAAFPGAEIIDP